MTVGELKKLLRGVSNDRVVVVTTGEYAPVRKVHEAFEGLYTDTDDPKLFIVFTEPLEDSYS